VEAGRIIGEQLSPRLRREVDYSADGYLTGQRVHSDTQTVVDIAYDYDAAGNLVERRDNRFGIDHYIYDPVGRIIQHIDPHGLVKQYQNDPAGDRLRTRIVARDPSPVTEPATPGEWSREGEYEGAQYRFDRAGNLIYRRDPRGELHLRWDANQRLIESRINDSTTFYRYDPLGRRIEKRTGEKTATFAWDGDALVGDLIKTVVESESSDHVIVREWVYYPETFEPMAMLGGPAGSNTLLHYHNDPNGCPNRITDSAGEVQWAASYTAWGQVARLYIGYVDNPIRLQGQYEDAETGLSYNRFRYYCPDLGSYVTPDPLGLGPGENNYAFAPNTFRWADPLGLTCKVTAKLQKLAGEAKAEARLSAKQQASIQRSLNRAAAATDPKLIAHHKMMAAKKQNLYMGTQIDTRFKAKVDADLELRKAGIVTTPRGQFGPDVVDKNGNRYWDLTTESDWNKGAHQSKYDKDFGSGTGIFW
jgi:RHS repeat-associated protein